MSSNYQGRISALIPGSFIRHRGLAALLAGLFYSCTTIIDLLLPQSPVFTRPTDYLIEAIFVSALLASLVSYAGIHHLHQGRAGSFETFSFVTIMVGTIGITLAAAATLVIGREVLGLVFLSGAVVAFLGSLCFGSAILRAGVLPRWLGWC